MSHEVNRTKSVFFIFSTVTALTIAGPPGPPGPPGPANNAASVSETLFTLQQDATNKRTVTQESQLFPSVCPSVENICDAWQHDAAHVKGRRGNSVVCHRNRKSVSQGGTGMERDPGTVPVCRCKQQTSTTTSKQCSVFPVYYLELFLLIQTFCCSSAVWSTSPVTSSHKMRYLCLILNIWFVCLLGQLWNVAQYLHYWSICLI